MYREEIKRQYIDQMLSTHKSSVHDYNYAFSLSTPFEEEWQKDVCDFTENEVEKMYQSASSYMTGRVINSRLRSYVDWCIENGYCKEKTNIFEKFSNHRLMQLIATEPNVITREEILDCLRKIPNACDRFILLGLFEGIRGDDYCELRHLKESDCNFKNNTVYIASRDTYMPVSKRLMDEIENCHYEDEYEPLLPSPNSRSRRFLLFNSGYVLKWRLDNPKADLVSEHQASRRVYHRLVKICQLCGIEEFSNIDIYYSGILDFIGRESKKKGVSKSQYWILYHDDICKHFGQEYSLRKIQFYRRYKKYLA